MTYFLLVLAIASNAAGNIFIKMSSERYALDIKAFFLKPWLLFQNGMLWLGILFFVAALGLYTRVLSEMNLSVAYPVMTSMGFLIVMGFSVWYLGESFWWWQWIGAVLIILGVVLLSQGHS